MQLEARVQIEIAATPEAVFDLGTDYRNFSRFTRLTWIYRFELSSALVYPVALLVRALFERWMNQTLERLRTLTEGEG